MTRKKAVGLMGFGVMGQALCKSFLGNSLLKPEDVMTHDTNPEAENRAREYGIGVAPDAKALTLDTQTLILCVKPQNMSRALGEISPWISDRQLLVSIAAGIPSTYLESRLAKPIPVIRVMPNLPCTVGEGMIAYNKGKYANANHIETTRILLGGLGRLIEVQEEMMDAVTGLGGSGPAFLFSIIEALADAGVYLGFSRQVSLIMAAQTTLGAAKMVLETGRHPAELRDMVASPGGTAITGILALERTAVKAGLMEAVVEAYRKSVELGKDRASRESVPYAATSV